MARRRRRTGLWLGGGLLAGAAAGVIGWLVFFPERVITVIGVAEGVGSGVLARRTARFTDAGAVAAASRLASNYRGAPLIVSIWTRGAFSHVLVGAGGEQLLPVPLAEGLLALEATGLADLAKAHQDQLALRAA